MTPDLRTRDALRRANDLVVRPIAHLLHALNQSDRGVLLVLLIAAGVLGFIVARRKYRPRGRRIADGSWRFPTFQNRGEGRVSRALLAQFAWPDYHLMNHLTLQMDDGTTQIDHVLISRFGVFVIETKDYDGWIFADAHDEHWTQVHFRRKSRFQNPLFQNKRHVRAVRELLEFLPAGALTSIVVFTGEAEFQTPMPAGVVTIHRLADTIRQHTNPIIALDQLQLAVGRLETARLAISRQTDVEHIESLARRHRPLAQRLRP